MGRRGCKGHNRQEGCQSHNRQEGCKSHNRQEGLHAALGVKNGLKMNMSNDGCGRGYHVKSGEQLWADTRL